MLTQPIIENNGCLHDSRAGSKARAGEVDSDGGLNLEHAAVQGLEEAQDRCSSPTRWCV